MTEYLRQTAYDRIRELLLSGSLPPGTHLSARALGKHFGMSLIPVREAIGQLSHEGLVDHQPGRGAFVHWPTDSELGEVYEIREALECFAAERACRQGQPEALAEIRRCNAVLESLVVGGRGGAPAGGISEDDDHNWVRADTDLHLALLRPTGNRRMIELVGNLRIMAQVFGGGRGGQSDSEENRLRIVQEHAELIDALAGGDAERAQQVLSGHIRTGLREAKRLLSQRLLGHRQDPTAEPGLAGLLGREGA